MIYLGRCPFVSNPGFRCFAQFTAASLPRTDHCGAVQLWAPGQVDHLGQRTPLNHPLALKRHGDETGALRNSLPTSNWPFRVLVDSDAVRMVWR